MPGPALRARRSVGSASRAGLEAAAAIAHTYSHVAPEISREAGDRIAETLWQDDEDQADEPEAAELGEGQEVAE